jgi:chromosomal replication initiation ATPase DnaA
MQQEIFDFRKVERLDWSDFVVSEENRDAILSLAKWPDWNGNGLIIYGGSGAGKTHLASLWARTASAVYILKESLNHSPRDLFATENNFVIDNFEDFIGTSGSKFGHDWMFHFLNIVKEKNRFFLLLSRAHQSLWPIELEDLRSRLLAIPSVDIAVPGDDLLLKISQKISKDLEITIPDDAIRYILNTAERKVSSIADILKKLDKLSLQQKKRLSLAYIRNNLELLNT